MVTLVNLFKQKKNHMLRELRDKYDIDGDGVKDTFLLHSKMVLKIQPYLLQQVI
jgi:hypothetical protein